jgi:hypothetical protein
MDQDNYLVDIAEPIFYTQFTSYNTVFTLRACSRVIAATPPHRAASAAKGQGSAGPVRWYRENGTLSEIRETTLQ